jgi:hypothetical protein
MPHGSDEVLFIGIILGIAVFILVVMLAGVVIIYFYEHRRNDKLTFRSLASTITDFFPEAKSKKETAPSSSHVIAAQIAPETESHDKSEKESLFPSPAQEAASAAVVAAVETESTPGSSTNDSTDSTLERAREAIDGESWSTRQIFGVALTGALMLVPVLEVPQIVMEGDSSLFRALPLLPLWAAAVAAIGFRTAKLSWRQTVLSVALMGAALLVNAGLQGILSNERFLLLESARGLIWASGGLFLLPLFDPAVRKTGPAPSRWKIAVTALALSVLYAFLFLRAGSNDSWESLLRVALMPRIPFVPSGVLLVLGLVVALFAPRAITGSWLGGVGILCSYFMYFGPLGFLVLFPPI